MAEKVLFGMKKEGNIISLTRDCLVEDALFILEKKAEKGDILYFKDENRKELINDVYGSHKNIIVAYRLGEKFREEGISEMLYFAGDSFDTTPDYWFSKETMPKIYSELKKIEKQLN
jgi:hypothetical protein